MAVVATLSYGYDLDSIWTQVDRDPAKVPGQLIPSGQRERRGSRQAAGGARAQRPLASATGGRIERQHERKAGDLDLCKAAAQRPISAISRLSALDRPAYDLLSGKRQAPDGTPLGRAPASGRKAAEVDKALLAATPHATAECERSL